MFIFKSVSVFNLSNSFQINRPFCLVLLPFFGVKKSFNSPAIQRFFALKNDKITSPKFEHFI